MTYDELLKESDNLGLIVKEANLTTRKGYCYGNRIAIKNNLSTYEKACVLAEELGHYHTTVGNISNQDNMNNRKQELVARKWGYNKKIGLMGLIKAFEYGCLDLFEVADYLKVTPEYLNEAIDYYRNRYGVMYRVDDYIIYFIPKLYVGKLFY